MRAKIINPQQYALYPPIKNGSINMRHFPARPALAVVFAPSPQKLSGHYKNSMEILKRKPYFYGN